jgi:hypothetical protein
MGLPNQVQKYFWGDSLEELDSKTHFHYITQTILDHGDEVSLQWLFAIYPEESIQTELPNLKLTQKSANYWNLYFS